MKEFRISGPDGEDADMRLVAGLDYGTVVELQNEPCLVVYESGDCRRGLVSLSNPRKTWDDIGGISARVLGKLTVTIDDFR